MKKLRLR